MKPINAALVAGSMSALVALLRDAPIDRILVVAPVTGCLVFVVYSYLYGDAGGHRK